MYVEVNDYQAKIFGPWARWPLAVARSGEFLGNRRRRRHLEVQVEILAWELWSFLIGFGLMTYLENYSKMNNDYSSTCFFNNVNVPNILILKCKKQLREAPETDHSL